MNMPYILHLPISIKNFAELNNFWFWLSWWRKEGFYCKHLRKRQGFSQKLLLFWNWSRFLKVKVLNCTIHLCALCVDLSVSLTVIGENVLDCCHHKHDMQIKNSLTHFTEPFCNLLQHFIYERYVSYKSLISIKWKSMNLTTN